MTDRTCAECTQCGEKAGKPYCYAFKLTLTTSPRIVKGCPHYEPAHKPNEQGSFL